MHAKSCPRLAQQFCQQAQLLQKYIPLSTCVSGHSLLQLLPLSRCTSGCCTELASLRRGPSLLLHTVECTGSPGTAQGCRQGRQLTLRRSPGQALHPLCNVVGQQWQHCLGRHPPQCCSLGQALILPWWGILPCSASGSQSLALLYADATSSQPAPVMQAEMAGPAMQGTCVPSVAVPFVAVMDCSITYSRRCAFSSAAISGLPICSDLGAGHEHAGQPC